MATERWHRAARGSGRALGDALPRGEDHRRVWTPVGYPRRAWWPALSLILADAAGALSAAAGVRLEAGATVSALLPAATCLFLCWLAVGARAGLYTRATARDAWHDMPGVISSTLQGSGLACAVLALLGASGLGTEGLGTLIALSIPARLAARALPHLIAGAGYPLGGVAPARSRTLIIGGGQIAQLMAAAMITHEAKRAEVVGFVDDHELRSGVERLLGRPVFTGAQLAEVIEGYGVDRVIFAFSLLPDSEGISLLRICQRYPHLQVSLVPRLFEALPARTRVRELGGIPIIQFEGGGRRAELACKRAIDLLGAGLALALAAPIVLLASLAIRLEGPGPVLFRQERVGRDGVPFTMYKLRSMREPRPGEGIDAPSRHTRVGRLLRLSSIDELPQLWNVVRGDMSLVGPRPEREVYVRQFSEGIPRYTERLRMRGGLTGLAQVQGLRGSTSIVERTRLDNFYTEQWGLWLDLTIILRTLTALIPRSQGIGGESMLRDVVTEVEMGTANSDQSLAGQLADPPGGGAVHCAVRG